KEMQPAQNGGHGDASVFPGRKPRAPLSNMAFLMLMRRMGRGDLTAHGFRATFKTWSSERTAVQNEIAEAALAHVIGDKVEQAYRRGDLFEKRRRLMQQWATFCTTATAQERQSNVTPLRASCYNWLAADRDCNPTRPEPHWPSAATRCGRPAVGACYILKFHHGSMRLRLGRRKRRVASAERNCQTSSASALNGLQPRPNPLGANCCGA